MLLVLIENPESYDDLVRPDMERWCARRCKHHHQDGELLIEIAPGRRRVMLPEWVKRLASFNVRARVVRRTIRPY